MVRNIIKTTFILGALASLVGPVSVSADTPELPEDASVWVVNNHGLAVQVYLVDGNGEEHRLGTANGGIESIALPSDLIDDGPVRIKVKPLAPPVGLGVSVANGPAIRTQDITIAPGAEVFFFVERDLTRSTTTTVTQ